MKQQNRINKIIEAVEARIQDEVGALLGTEFFLIGGERQLLGKKAVFEGLLGKQICAHMDITGETTGRGCLLLGIKDAIRLGGTLIMLPSGELEEVIGRELYNEEVEDSYGEIANIIAGSLTKDFEEMYPKSCRFVRKEQEIIIPAKVDIESDSPIANQTYYQVSSSMVLDGRNLGDMVMLLPAATFDMQEAEKAEQTGSAEEQDEGSAAAETSAEPAVCQEEAQQPIQADKEVEQPKKAAAEPKFDRAKQQKRVNGLLAECKKKMEAELEALLGVDVSLDDLENQLLTKEEFLLNKVAGRQVLADMEVVGELEGKGYLVISTKDAIHLGGVLIMLPPAELDNVVSSEEFGEDARDAYGEIANIISGVYTAVFEEQYSQKLRFVRKDFRDIVPAKIDMESDDVIPNNTYYASSLAVVVEGKPLGRMHMLFPAEMLRLDSPKQQESSIVSPEEDRKTAAPKDNAVPEKAENRTSSVPGAGEQAENPAAPRPDVNKHKKRVDKLLTVCRDKMAAEVSALLGSDIKLTNPENLIVSKESFFFDEVVGKQVIANMDVVGELEGKSYLSVSLRDAIRIGGTLVMLPSAELEAVVAEEDFGADAQDAYGEIANIIAGVYTAVFEEQYTKRVRFVKNGLRQIAPMTVEIDSDDPLPDQDYYLSRMDLTMDDLGLGKVNMLFPADLLQLDGLGTVTPATGKEDEIRPVVAEESAEQRKTSREPIRGVEGKELKSFDILVVGDDDGESVKIAGVLKNSGYAVKTLSFKDNLHNYIPGNLKAIYLVTQQVNEQAFGVAIKVSSACSVPLVAAGPGWTRTKVIKAVKYGVRDILLTPASEEDIEESVNNNLLELAA